LGNEQYAYIPYDAAPETVSSLHELERDLDSERLRSQLVVALDPASRIADRTTASIWFDPRGMALFDPATGENLTRELAAAV
jgi:multiple sugar transport system ATP-binding protein